MSRLFASGNKNVIDLALHERPGRRKLVEQLFDEHARALRHFLLGWSIPPDEIDDVVQELFSRLLGVERLEEKMSDSTGSSRSYLLTMANNLIVDRRRKLQVRNAYAAEQRGIESESVDERTPERIIAAELELEAMRSVIKNMRLNWRVAFVLQRFGNLSYEEIALHMGVSVRQVDRYLVRAMRRIREAQRKIKAAGERSC